MKRFALLFVVIFLFTACSTNVKPDDNYTSAWAGEESFSDNDAFHSRTSIISGGDVICYYSNDSGLSLPLCNKPNCTHNISSSPDCNALAKHPMGIFTANGKLYFLELDKETDDMNLICADINGGNRRKIAAVSHGSMSAGFIDRIRFIDGKIIYTSYDTFDTELLDTANQIKPLEKYIATIKGIDVVSGEIKVLVKRQDYNARISNFAITDDSLVYLYNCHTSLPESGNQYTDEEWNEYYRCGVYSVDMNTGDEKCLTDGYNRMALVSSCFENFSYNRMIFYSADTKQLYRYNKEAGSFDTFAECANINTWFICDDKYALFLEKTDDECFQRYDFESGEITKLPREGFTPVYLNGTVSGDKVWFGYMDENNEYCRGYMSRNDLMNGVYDNFKFAYFVNEEA